DYTLDAAGNRTAATEAFDADDDPNTGPDGLEHSQSFTWGYDGLNRLVQEIFDSPDNTLDYDTAYQFDLASNRLKKLTLKAAGQETVTYSYDSNDRLTQEVKDAPGSNDDSNIIYGY